MQKFLKIIATCVTASTSTNIVFIDLASQVVGNTLTATDSGPVDTDFDIDRIIGMLQPMHLLQIPAVSRRQVTYLIMLPSLSQ